VPGPDLLQAEGVVAGYGGRTALGGVDLNVRGGEVVGLIGPNGSGKTTLIRVASRTLRPRSGRILLRGRDPFGLPAREAARLVAVVPQELAPTFAFTVLEVVLMGRSAYLSPWGGGGAQDYVRAREAMEAAGVQHLADRPIEELSGGEKQRAVLAQALAQDAPLLLLDEPTTHLDPGHVVAILDVVRALVRDRSSGVLAVFHDLNLASATCDRLVALDRGRVVTEGPPEEVITRSFLREVYGVEAEVYPHFATGRPTVILGPPLEPARVRGSKRAHVVGGAGRGGTVMRALAELGYEVTAGVLHATDTDAVVAERLNLERLTVPPFSEIDEESAAEVLELMRAAEVVVVCDAPFGPGNVRNLEAAAGAAAAGSRVVLLEQIPPLERDFTEGRATALWEALARRAQVVRSYEALVAAVGGSAESSGRGGRRGG
jgi:iron complex transport system ATP-binding protein